MVIWPASTVSRFRAAFTPGAPLERRTPIEAGTEIRVVPVRFELWLLACVCDHVWPTPVMGGLLQPQEHLLLLASERVVPGGVELEVRDRRLVLLVGLDAREERLSLVLSADELKIPGLGNQGGHVRRIL